MEQWHSVGLRLPPCDPSGHQCLQAAFEDEPSALDEEAATAPSGMQQRRRAASQPPGDAALLSLMGGATGAVPATPKEAEPVVGCVAAPGEHAPAYCVGGGVRCIWTDASCAGTAWSGLAASVAHMPTWCDAGRNDEQARNGCPSLLHAQPHQVQGPANGRDHGRQDRSGCHCWWHSMRSISRANTHGFVLARVALCLKVPIQGLLVAVTHSLDSSTVI